MDRIRLKIEGEQIYDANIGLKRDRDSVMLYVENLSGQRVNILRVSERGDITILPQVDPSLEILKDCGFKTQASKFENVRYVRVDFQ